jgi:putative membrane protein
MNHLFTDADRDRIAEAVRTAESRTSGEIVPVIVAQSDAYPFVVRRAGIVGLVFGAALFEALRYLYSGWAPAWITNDASLFIVMLVCAVLFGLAAARVSWIKRRLIGRDAIDRAVHSRAVHAFVEEEVFATRDRTGILLLVSLFEHRVEVMGDSGINAAVAEDDWADVIDDVIKGIRQGDASGGLIRGIERCGDLLEKKGVERREDDEDELSNRPRIS